MSLRSPLHESHRALGGRLVDFAGWDMPLQFSGVVAEHTAVRERVGLFDVSHLGKLLVEGPGAVEALERAVTNGVASMPEWRARYNLVLTEAGGIVDDLFVYRRPDAWLVVPNAANASAVLEAIRSAGGPDARVTDARQRWAILALQGPASRKVADSLLPGATDLPLHAFGDFDLNLGVKRASVQVARTGYTGEYGFELFVPSEDAPGVWELLLDAGDSYGILPVGLGARDTLRLEMGYPLHGHEISVDTNPIEAGLGWTIDWSKPDFVGREAVEAVRRAGPTRTLTGLAAEGPGIPRAGQAVLRDGEPVGTVTSGNYSPTLRKGIALAYVTPEAGEPGLGLEVDVRGKRLPVTVTKPPFVPRGRAAPKS
ncbi:MAG: aminomethyltransferase [Actinomycetota bacterium]|nr:aminomethyltransferase [Actinomycetota bacterium]